jgi:hypothetical protein
MSKIGAATDVQRRSQRRRPQRLPANEAPKRDEAHSAPPKVSKKASALGKRKRRKGIVGELEACKLWEPYFPEVRRSFGQARQGYEQPDLIGGMIERSFYIEVKRTKKPPSEGQIYRWELKLLADSNKYMSLGGEKSEYLFLMWRADHKEWQVSFWRPLGIDEQEDFVRVGWEDFEVELDSRLFPAVLSPPK